MTIGIAVVGAGMAGKAHAVAYRVAPTLYESTLPDLRYVSTGDMNAEVGRAAAATAMSAATRTGGPSPTTPTSRWSASSSRTACTSRWSGGSSRPASTCCARNRSPTPWPRHGRWPTWPGRPSPWFVSASPTAASFHQDTPSQVRLYLNDDHSGRNGYRTVNLGSDPLTWPVACRSMSPVSVSARTRVSPTRPGPSWRRSRKSRRRNPCPATHPSTKVSTTWKSSRPSPGRPRTTESR